MNFIPKREDCIHAVVCSIEKDGMCPLECGHFLEFHDYLKGGGMIAIRIKVPESAEFYDECEYFTLMQYTQDTEEKHLFAANQIAMFFVNYNIKFHRERAIPFQVEVLYFPLEQEIEYKTIIQAMLFTDDAIRKGIDPKTDIEQMRELIKLHDKFSKLANVLSSKAAEIKHTISKMLESHNELYL